MHSQCSKVIKMVSTAVCPLVMHFLMLNRQKILIIFKLCWGVGVTVSITTDRELILEDENVVQFQRV